MYPSTSIHTYIRKEPCSTQTHTIHAKTSKYNNKNAHKFAMTYSLTLLSDIIRLP